MTKLSTSTIVALALAGMTAGVTLNAQAAKMPQEKCYGVAMAGEMTVQRAQAPRVQVPLRLTNKPTLGSMSMKASVLA